MSKLQEKKGKAYKQEDMTSGQESEDSSNKEEEATTSSKKHSFKKKRGKHLAVSEKVTESIAVQSAECSFQKLDSPWKAHNTRPREKHNKNHGFKEASEQKSGFQSQGCMAKGERELEKVRELEKGKGERTRKRQNIPGLLSLKVQKKISFVQYLCR